MKTLTTEKQPAAKGGQFTYFHVKNGTVVVATLRKLKTTKTTFSATPVLALLVPKAGQTMGDEVGHFATTEQAVEAIAARL